MKPENQNPRTEQNRQTDQRKGQSNFGSSDRTARPGVECEANPAVKARQPEGSSRKEDYSSKSFSKDGIKKNPNKDSFVKNKENQNSNQGNKGGFRK